MQEFKEYKEYKERSQEPESRSQEGIWWGYELGRIDWGLRPFCTMGLMSVTSSLRPAGELSCNVDTPMNLLAPGFWLLFLNSFALC